MRILGSFFLAILALGAAPRRGEFRLQEHLPGTTILFAEISNSEDFRASFRTGRLHELIQDPELRRFLEPAWEQFEEATREFERTVGIPWDRAWELAKGQTAFAALSAGPEKKWGPDFILSFDCLGEREKVLKALEFARSRIEKATGKRLESWRVQEQEIWEGSLADEIPIQIAVVGEVLLVGNRRSSIGGIVKSLRGEPGDRLVKAPKFLQAREKFPNPEKGGELFLFANLSRVLEEVESRSEEETKKLIDLFGMRSFTFAAGQVLPEKDVVREDFFLAVSGERKGLARLFSLQGPAPDLALAPAGAIQFASLSIHLTELWRTTLEVLGGLDEIQRQRFVESIRRFEKEAGISIETDLIPAFGTRVYGYSMLPPEGLLPDGITVFEIQDQEKLDRSLRTIAANLQAEWAYVTFQDRKIEYLRFHQASDDPLRIFLGSVYLLRSDKHLIVTGVASLLGGVGVGSPNAIKRLLLRKGGATLADTPELKEGWGGKLKEASAVLYVDYERFLVPIYNSLSPFVFWFSEALKAAGVPSNPSDLPRGKTLGRSLAKVLLLLHAEKEGLFVRSRSGSGLTLLTAVYGAGGLLLSLPAIRQAEIRAKTRRCESNLYMIQMGMHRCRSERGKYPEAMGSALFQELSESGYVLDEYVRCPHSGKGYLGPTADPNTLASDAFLFADDPAYHPDGRIHAMTVGGAVLSLSKGDADYDRALQGTQK